MGALFAREVERADERSRGEGLEAKRLGEIEGERRSARRAGFERQADEHDARPPRRSRTTEAELAGAPMPHDAPVHAAEPARNTPDQAPRAATATASPEPGHGAAAPQVSVPALAAGTPAVAPTSSPGPALPPSLEPVAAPVPARSATAPSAAAALQRPGAERTAKAQPSASLPPGPDPALLERAEAVLRQIKLHLAPGVRRITLDLEPAELGRLAVQLSLRAGKVTAIVRSADPATLALLQQREADLRQVFAERGVQPDSFRFELGFGGRSAGERAPGRRTAGPTGARPTPEAAPLTALTPPRSSAALVDTFA